MAQGKKTARARSAPKTAARKPKKRAAKPEQPTLLETAPPASASELGGKRIGMTLRLEPEMWVRLKNLATRLSVKRGRPVSVHELVVAGIKALLLRYDAAEINAGAEDD